MIASTTPALKLGRRAVTTSAMLLAMAWRRGGRAGGSREGRLVPRGRRARALNALLAERLAAHFEGATAHAGSADLPVERLSVDCKVAWIDGAAGLAEAALFLRLRGGALGDVPVFASISGYGENPEDAVATGICQWACALGPVLTAGLGGVPDERVTTLPVVVDGRAHRLVVASLDRGIGAPDHRADLSAARALAGGDPWLTTRVLGSGTLPTLPAGRSTLLGVFVGVTPDEPMLEVKVNGADWLASAGVFGGCPAGPPGRIHLLRELAVLVPQEGVPDQATAATLLADRETLQRHLDRLSVLTLPGQAAGWRGWRTHGGRLGAPLAPAQLADVERASGALPQDYRRFLTEIAGMGAGPGYGLLAPYLSRGRVVPLAHAGCGATWVLRTDGAHRGEVWIDAEPIDGHRALVAPSFTQWYADWLARGLRGEGPWIHWNATDCTPAAGIQRLISELTVPDQQPPVTLTGKLSRTALFGGGAHLRGPSSRLDPCHACLALHSRHGIDDAVFERGALSAR